MPIVAKAAFLLWFTAPPGLAAGQAVQDAVALAAAVRDGARETPSTRRKGP